LHGDQAAQGSMKRVNLLWEFCHRLTKPANEKVHLPRRPVRLRTLEGGRAAAVRCN